LRLRPEDRDEIRIVRAAPATLREGRGKMNRTADDIKTIRELVAAWPETRKVLDRFGIDYCFGGSRDLASAAADSGVDEAELKEAIEEAIREGGGKASAERDWSKAPLSELADHIEKFHHARTRQLIAETEKLLAEAMEAEGPFRGGSLFSLRRMFESFAVETERHLFEEEVALFPYFRQLDAFSRGLAPRPHIFCDSARYPISVKWKEHEDTGENLAGFRRLTNNYRSVPEAGETVRRLHKKLRELEEELKEHIHLENNILFPRGLEIERTCGIACGDVAAGSEAAHGEVAKNAAC